MTQPPTPHSIACKLAKSYHSPSDLSEADIRHRVIDTVLHDVLSWPKASVICESFIAPGYADYVLTGQGDSQLLFIEAKREGIYFTLPSSFNSTSQNNLIKVKTLLTDDAISFALNQVQNYCINAGCEYACITNGHQWIFFKTFERNHDWRTLDAFVIRELGYFCNHFTEVSNILSYISIVEHAALAQKLGSVRTLRRERFYPKTKVPEYNHIVHQNHLAAVIRPLADRYLGRMNETDDEFMERCYVRIRDYQASITGVTAIIRDSLTPYFKGFNVRDPPPSVRCDLRFQTRRRQGDSAGSSRPGNYRDPKISANCDQLPRKRGPS